MALVVKLWNLRNQTQVGILVLLGVKFNRIIFAIVLHPHTRLVLAWLLRVDSLNTKWSALDVELLVFFLICPHSSTMETWLSPLSRSHDSLRVVLREGMGFTCGIEDTVLMSVFESLSLSILLLLSHFGIVRGYYAQLLLIGWCLGLLVVSRLERFVKIVRLRCSCQDCFQIVLRSAILRRPLQTKHSGSSSSYLASLILSSQRHCLLELQVGWWLQIPLWLAFHHYAHLTTDQLVYVVRFPVFLHRGILPHT
jgi:hypothetical protein